MVMNRHGEVGNQQGDLVAFELLGDD